MTRNNTKDFDESHELISDTVHKVQAEIERGKLLISSGLMGKRTVKVMQAVIDSNLLFIAALQARVDGVSMNQLADAINTVLDDDIKIRKPS